MNGFSVLLILKLLAISQSAPSGEQKNSNDTVDCTTAANNGRSFPNLKNCSSYYQCENRTETLMNCSAGQHFNPRLKVCDDPLFANCKINGTSAPILLPIEIQNTTENINPTEVAKNNVTGTNTTLTRSKSTTVSSIPTRPGKSTEPHVIKSSPKRTDLNSTTSATNSGTSDTSTVNIPVKEGQNNLNNLSRNDKNNSLPSNSTKATVNVSNGKDITVGTSNSTESSDSTDGNDSKESDDENANNDN